MMMHHRLLVHLSVIVLAYTSALLPAYADDPLADPPDPSDQSDQSTSAQPEQPALVRNSGQVMYIIGSTLMKDYTTAILDQLSKNSNIPPAIVVSRGTTRGVQAFCSGTGLDTPDIVTMSRRMRMSEIDDCRAHGVNDIIEIQVGYEANGIVSNRNDQLYPLTLVSLYRSVAAELPVGMNDFVPNKYTRWHDVDPKLPNTEIHLVIPVVGLGGRTFLEDQMLQTACRGIPEIKGISGASERVKQCVALRTDGRITELDIPYGPNVARTLAASAPGTLAVVPLHSVAEYQSALRLQPLDGVIPSYETVSNHTYKLTRPLYYVIKKAHVKDYWKNGLVSGLREFITEITAESTIGPNGYLTQLGLFPLNEATRNKVRASSLRLETVDR